MAAFLDAIDARYDAILFANRGGSAPYSPAAQALAIPAQSLRRAPDAADLRSPLSAEGGEFDRCSYREWLSSAPLDGPRNSFDGSQPRRCRFNEVVGLVYGAASAARVMPAVGSESAATAVQYVRRRALSLGEQIAAAYEFSEIVGTDTDPSIIDTRLADAGVSVEDLGGGRLLLVVAFECWLDRRGAYRP